MREYRCKYPMEEVVIDSYHYKNLLRDGEGKVMSENITSIPLENSHSESRELAAKRVMEEIELKAREYCPKIEVGYEDSLGNRWIFLLFNGEPTKEELMQMRKCYEELYDPEFARWREEYNRLSERNGGELVERGK